MIDELISLLEQITFFLELLDENPFKIRAIASAARTLEIIRPDIAEAVRLNKVPNIAGIGKSLQAIIREFVQTGKISMYDELRAKIPPGLIEMAKINGLGAKKIRAIHLNLGISTIGELEYACKENQLATIAGFGEKTQANILKQLALFNANKGHFHLHKAANDVAEIFDLVRKHEPNSLNLSAVSKHEDEFSLFSDEFLPKSVKIVGEISRFSETVENLEFIADKSQEETVWESFAPYLAENGGKTPHGIPISLKFASAEDFIWQAHLATGTADYRTALFSALEADGFSPTEKNLSKNGEPIIPENEYEIFRCAGLSFIPAELRESAEEVALARENSLPKLVKESQMRGMLHIHTNWSDGKNSVLEMALAAKSLGYSYIAICDHSQTASYANGLKLDKIKAQHEEINALNEENLGIKILKGIESDILGEGQLDYPDEILAQFDVVVASVHSRFSLSEEAQTSRIVNVLKNPFTTILGHPTGRLLLARECYALKIEEIIETAAEFGKIIEINANPYRLDFSWRNVRKAKKLGVKFAINPDAHHVDEMRYVRFGIGVARKGMISAKEVVNTLELSDFLKSIGKT